MIDSDNKSSDSISFCAAQSGTDFVGVKIDKAERKIIFPMGYALNEKSLGVSKINKDERKIILNLIKSIQSCSKNKNGQITARLNGEPRNDFPISAIFSIIEDFLDRSSYYTEKESVYTRATGGKINWSRTIKNIKPIVSETGIAFLNFIIRKNRIQENQLITELHKYCVYKAFELFGFLYTTSLPEKGLLVESDISKNRKHYAQFLHDKIDSTHLESNIELFSNMLELINNLDCESETKDAAYGTTSYQVVWENMVNSVFGTISQKEKEKYFYPASRWTFVDKKTKANAPLRPDTIMILGEGKNRKCFIIDSKYYSYTTLREKEIGDEDGQETVLVHGSIPGTDSIQKQITYAQYIDKDINNYDVEKRSEFRFFHKDIYNVFILPVESPGSILNYIGRASSDWNDNSKNYHKIHAVTLDTKFLLENFGRNNKSLQERLAECLYSAPRL